MRVKDIVNNTSNSAEYNKAVKCYRGLQGDIYCSICPYHRGENRRWHRNRDSRSWKRYRKTQYKIKGCGDGNQ